MKRRVACLVIAVSVAFGGLKPQQVAGSSPRSHPIHQVHKVHKPHKAHHHRRHHRISAWLRHHRSVLRRRLSVVRAARSMLGVRYVYAGSSRYGTDCSGLTRYVYERIGIHLPHLASAQERMGTLVHRELKPGDLLFFRDGGHVGMYVGNGKMIAASSVYGEVKYTDLAAYDRYDEARRLIH